MNETNINVHLGYVDGLTEQIQMLARQVDWWKTRHGVDPDGRLAETAAVLRQKRGCRR